MRRILFILLAMMAIGAVSSGAATGVKLLTVEAGARPVGMGGAFTAVVTDPYSAAYNPAGGYGVGPLAGSIGHNAHWEKVRIETGYLVFQKKDITFAAGLQYAVDGELQGRDRPTEEFYPFDAHDVMFKMGASFKVDKNIVVGFMAGWIYEKIDIYRGSAMNVDLGLLIEPVPKVRAGLAVLNLGGKMQIRQEEYDLPRTIRAGISYQLEKFLPAADLVILDDKVHLHLGGEYAIREYFFIRAGYRAGYDTKDISAGAGFARRNLRVDYAFLPYKDGIWDSHLINLTFHL